MPFSIESCQAGIFQTFHIQHLDREDEDILQGVIEKLLEHFNRKVNLLARFQFQGLAPHVNFR